MRVKFIIPVCVNGVSYKADTYELPLEISEHWFIKAMIKDKSAIVLDEVVVEVPPEIPVNESDDLDPDDLHVDDDFEIVEPDVVDETPITDDEILKDSDSEIVEAESAIANKDFDLIEEQKEKNVPIEEKVVPNKTFIEKKVNQGNKRRNR